jgi:hypothetical protein
MSARQDEAIAAHPVGIGGIVTQELLKNQVSRWGQAHSGARMAVSGGLHGIHCQGANVVNGLAVQIRGPAAARTAFGRRLFLRGGHAASSFRTCVPGSLLNRRNAQVKRYL